jgi:hypothetical protein
MHCPKTHGERIIEECQRIETLCRIMADAASRRFKAPIDDEDFEAGDGPDYSLGLRSVRILLERVAQYTLGIDCELDESFTVYMTNVLRIHPRDRKPALFQIPIQ